MQACSKCGHLLILYSVSDETECCGCGEVCPTPLAPDGGESPLEDSPFETGIRRGAVVIPPAAGKA